MSVKGQCRFCGKDLNTTFVDLGMSPLCESFLSADQLDMMEPFYPLHVLVCDSCFLVQLKEYVEPKNIFEEYAYFSSYSSSWLEHSKKYVDQVAKRFNLGKNNLAVEIASNDGYLLQYFLPKEIPCLGIEPAKNVAQDAINKGIPTITEFFNTDLANQLSEEGKRADLLLGNNVLAQVPDLNDFVNAMSILLNENGVITMEFPHLVCLISENQFDTIYHEHFSYFSFLTVEKIFNHHGLNIFDVEELPTHGGSLRIYGCHSNDKIHDVMPSIDTLRAKEERFGLYDIDSYSAFSDKVCNTKRNILDFLIKCKREGKTIAGYGAPGKGNTLLNYCGIRSDFIDYTVDRNPYKHGKYLPGTHIPILKPESIRENKPDYLFILPWNLKDEIVNQQSYIREWGGKFILPIPELTVLN